MAIERNEEAALPVWMARANEGRTPPQSTAWRPRRSPSVRPLICCCAFTSEICPELSGTLIRQWVDIRNHGAGARSGVGWLERTSRPSGLARNGLRIEISPSKA